MHGALHRYDLPHCRAGCRRPAPRWLAIVVLLAGTLPFCHAAAQDAQPDTTQWGRIEGQILDHETGRPLPRVTVMIPATGRGSFSQADGRFRIDGVPPGRSVVHISFFGYAEIDRTVDVPAGGTATLEAQLEPTVVATLDPLQIHGLRPLIDVRKTSTAHALTRYDLEAMLTRGSTLDQIVEQQPGVVRDRGQLHFRGGRADESLFIVDGVGVRDLLSGESGGTEIAARSAQEVNVMTGGFGARYSQAMSGVVETRLKEGTPDWHGAFSYETDVLFGDLNSHQMNVEVSGPNRLVAPLLQLAGDEKPEVTFYASLSSELGDGYLPSVSDMPGRPHLYSAVRDQFLGSSFEYGDALSLLAENDWRGLIKTAWRADADNKFSVSFSKSLSIGPDWGDPDIGEVDRNVTNYPWSWALHLDHNYTITRDVNILSLIWNHTLAQRTHSSLRLWRHYSGQHKDVAGQRWDHYDTTRDSERLDDTTFVDTPYFIDSGDAEEWRDRFVVVWGLSNDWSVELGTHAIDAGFSAEYHDVQYMALNARTVDLVNDLPLGDEYDLFHVTPNAGTLYAQDRFEHEGMEVSLGAAYDYWFPGAQVEQALATLARPHMTPELRRKFYAETHELFGHRYKGHLSPRVGVSFPVTRDGHLYFNYGHYSQRPPYYYVYAKSSSQSGEEYPRIGNPTLNPQISVSYEIGGEYQFSKATAAKVSLFWKDMYDYPTSIRLVMKERRTARSNFFMYWNMDYARSRGIEISLVRNRRNFLWGSLSYTYSLAKGKSSDPNKTKLIQETGGDSREPQLEEESLWWNRPHKLTAQVNLLIKEDERPPRWLGFAWPQDFNTKLYFTIRSGRPYTPLDAQGRTVGDPYSLNGPIDMTCDLALAKGFRIGGRRIEAFFNVYNLFNYRTPLSFDPVTGEAYRPGVGSLIDPQEDARNYSSYLETTVDAKVAAYVRDYNRLYGKNPDESLIADYSRQVAEGVRYDFTSNYYSQQDPSSSGQPRTYRMGLSYVW